MATPRRPMPVLPAPQNPRSRARHCRSPTRFQSAASGSGRHLECVCIILTDKQGISVSPLRVKGLCTDSRKDGATKLAMQCTEGEAVSRRPFELTCGAFRHSATAPWCQTLSTRFPVAHHCRFDSDRHEKAPHGAGSGGADRNPVPAAALAAHANAPAAHRPQGSPGASRAFATCAPLPIRFRSARKSPSRGWDWRRRSESNR